MRLRDSAMSLLLAGVILAVPVGMTFAAQQSPADAIKARQQHMKDLGGANKAINDQLKADAPDMAAIKEAAAKGAAAAKEVGSLFPKGSGTEAGVETAAKPEIWAQPADFKAAADKLVAEENKMVQVAATGDKAAIADQIKAVGGACGDCHKVFRVPPKRN